MRQNLRKALLPLALLGLVAPAVAPAAAEEAPAGPEETPAEPVRPDIAFYGEIVSTATLSEEPSFDIAAPTLVIEDLEERLPDNAAQVLTDQPGVDVNGVGPNQSRPVIRGQRGHRVLFLEDGLRMNNARRQTDFGEITGLTDISTVESVEVVRGPSSVLWGSDAIGGVLNLITRVPAFGAKQLAGGLGVRYSDADKQEKVDASLSGGSQAFSWGLTASVREAENYEAPAGSYGGVRLASDTAVSDTAVEDESYSLYLGYRASERNSAFFKYSAYSADRAGFGLIEPELLGQTDRVAITYPFQDFERFTVGWLGAIEAGAVDLADVKLYYQTNQRELAFEIDSLSPFMPPFEFALAIDTLNFTDFETFGVRAELTKAIGETHLFAYGLEWVDDDSTNTDTSRTVGGLVAPFPPFFIPFFDLTDTVPNTPNAANTNYGLFAQDSITLRDNLRVTVGARFNKVETSAQPTPGHDISGLDFDDDDVVGAVSIVYGVNERLNLVASYGTAFRAANIIERLFNGPTPEGFGYQITNAGLESEESRNVDVGLRYLSSRGYFELTYFDNEIENGIVQSVLSPAEFAALPPALQAEISQLGFQNVVIQQRNADMLKFDGIEAIGSFRVGNRFTLGFNYTHLEGERVASAISPTGDSANDKYNVFARYEAPGGRYWTEYHVRRQEDQDAPVDSDTGLSLPAFTVHRLSAGVDLFETAGTEHRLVLIVQNLFDELYAESSNASFFRPAPRRSLIASYRMGLR